MARQVAGSWEGHTSRRLRKKIELLFAHLPLALLGSYVSVEALILVRARVGPARLLN
jgi:hypothetical protein